MHVGCIFPVVLSISARRNGSPKPHVRAALRSPLAKQLHKVCHVKSAPALHNPAQKATVGADLRAGPEIYVYVDTAAPAAHVLVPWVLFLQ